MADHFTEVNMNDAVMSGNTFSVKVEQWQEDGFVDDKVYISETAITTDNAELQGPICYGKIKQSDESTCLDNIKTEELGSLEMPVIQNDNIKVEISADDLTTEITELDNRLLYCEHCEEYYVNYCIECGMLVQILNKHALNNAVSGARKDIPNDILEIQDCFGRTGIYALRIIPAGVKFGPFTGFSATECPWKLHGQDFVLDKNKSEYLNWMQYVNLTRNTCDGNLHVLQTADKIYYRSTHQIQAGDELLVYFGEEYGNSLNKIITADFATTTKDITEDVFACTFCCLGFSSKLHLAKHKTVCIEGAARMFSIEELMQCPFCKTHLDPKEYFKHLMAFCCEKNARKCILPTPSAKQGTAALNGEKGYLRQIYRCEQCKYRTKYQADLKTHTKEHYQVKMYKCKICNRRFKIKESLRLHVENTHAYVGGKDDRENYTTEKKIFKCSLCAYRARDKHYLRTHIKTKHLKQFDYKCDKCKYRTNNETDLKIHQKTNHLKQFDFKCDSCEYKTNKRRNLEAHIKTNHLKQFDYKCDKCEYRTNDKYSLEIHIKSIHLKEFDYKCDECEFGANRKDKLEIHIKTKHLKEFEYTCDICGYRTNNKHNLGIHIKSIHLKEFDYKCDACEFRTNRKTDLKRHINSKHLKEFDYKCDNCKFGTNQKQDLERHMKANHLKEFDNKCDSCEYRTNNKCNLEVHIKTKHLKKFDYKCDKCKYRTNNKADLKIHQKTKHLKQFDFKCDSCEYRTNKKSNLEVHTKTKHLKQFDYKCDKCKYRTNEKYNLEIHIKSTHFKEFDYKCDKCEYRTNAKYNLEYHIKTKHLKEF